MEPKSKTIGELRSFIVENGGLIKLGPLSFKCEKEEGTDLDICLEEELILWITLTQEASTPLGDVHVSGVGTFHEQSLKAKEAEGQLTEKNSQIEELQKQIEKLKQKERVSELNNGKVEAYEKLLIGRAVTIGK